MTENIKTFVTFLYLDNRQLIVTIFVSQFNEQDVMKTKIIKRVTFAIVGLYFIIWLASPTALFYAINKELAAFDIHLTKASHFRFNPFTACLTIEKLGLEYQNPAEKVRLVTLNEAVVNVNLIDLILLDFRIEKIKLDGLEIELQQSPTGIAITGIPLDTLLPKTETANKTDTGDTENQTPSSSALPFSISSDHISINNSIISFLVTDENNEAIQQQVIDLKEVRLSSLSFDNNQLDFILNVGLRYHLAHLLERNQLTANIHLVGKQKLALNQPTLVVNVNDFKLELDQLFLLTPDWEVELDNYTFKMDELMFKQSEEQENIELSAKADSSLNMLDVYASNSRHKAVELTAIAIDNISVYMQGNQPQVTIPQIDMQQLILMKNSTVKAAELLLLESLAVNTIQATPAGVSINNIAIGELRSQVIINQEKQFSNLYLPVSQETEETKSTDELASTNQATTTLAETKQIEPTHLIDNQSTGNPSADNQSNEENDFQIQIKNIYKQGEMTFQFDDFSLTPSFSTIVKVNEFNVSEINSQTPELVSNVVIKGEVDEFTKFDLQSEHQPFLTTPAHNINFNVSELSLQELSPYVRDALAYDINNGQLDTEIKLHLNGQHIDGDTDLLLRSVDLSSIDEQGEKETISSGAISFNYALGMLKDSDGNVELNVPIDGDVDDPNIGMSGFLSLMVKQATMSAAKDYLITTFVPYAKVAKLAMSAGEYLLKLEFNPLEFEAGQAELTGTQQDYLHQLKLVLEKHPDINVKLCPVAKQQDLPALAKKKELTEKDIAQYSELSKARALNMKTWLVKQENIQSSRLLACAPTMDSEHETTARIEISQL